VPFIQCDALKFQQPKILGKQATTGCVGARAGLTKWISRFINGFLVFSSSFWWTEKF